jgi:hypothetical protein
MFGRSAMMMVDAEEDAVFGEIETNKLTFIVNMNPLVNKSL